MNKTNEYWNNFKQCNVLVFSIVCLALTEGVSEQAAVI